jgi:hypothetical protein
MPTNTDPAIYDLPSRPVPPDLEWLDEFVCEGLIVEVLARLESGKGATVFVCRGGVAGHAGFVASALTFVFVFSEYQGLFFLPNGIHAMVLNRLHRSGNRNERYAKISFRWNPTATRSVVGLADVRPASRRALWRKSRGGKIFLAANH